MKNYLAIYTGSESSMSEWKSMDAGQRAAKEEAGMEAWKTWVTTNASSIVDQGAPLGQTKRISPAGISDIRNNMTAYTVVRAESHEAAARMFEHHPHFAIFPGEAVEIMPVLPIPRG